MVIASKSQEISWLQRKFGDQDSEKTRKSGNTYAYRNSNQEPDLEGAKLQALGGPCTKMSCSSRGRGGGLFQVSSEPGGEGEARSLNAVTI